MNARNRLNVIGFLVVILISFGGCATTETAIPDVRGQTWDYVVLGSSIGAWWAREYGSLVESDLRVQIRYHNYYVGGQQVGDLLYNVLNDELLREDIGQAELATIDVGFTDLYFGALAQYRLSDKTRLSIRRDRPAIKKRVKKSAERYETLLDEILKLASPGDTLVRVMDFYFPFVATYKEKGVFEEAISHWKAFSRCIIRLARRRGIASARVFLLFNGSTGEENPVAKGWIHGDGLHPNETGKRLIAGEFRKLG